MITWLNTTNSKYHQLKPTTAVLTMWMQLQHGAHNKLDITNRSISQTEAPRQVHFKAVDRDIHARACRHTQTHTHTHTLNLLWVEALSLSCQWTAGLSSPRETSSTSSPGSLCVSSCLDRGRSATQPAAAVAGEAQKIPFLCAMSSAFVQQRHRIEQIHIFGLWCSVMRQGKSQYFYNKVRNEKKTALRNGAKQLAASTRTSALSVPSSLASRSIRQMDLRPKYCPGRGCTWPAGCYARCSVASAELL